MTTLTLHVVKAIERPSKTMARSDIVFVELYNVTEESPLRGRFSLDF